MCRNCGEEITFSEDIRCWTHKDDGSLAYGSNQADWCQKSPKSTLTEFLDQATKGM